MSAKFTKRTRFFHASPKRFRHGDILTGGHEGGWGAEHPMVCMTDHPDPPVTIREKALEENWFVYEIEPLYNVYAEHSNSEFQTLAAKIVRCIGNVRALDRGQGSAIHLRPYKGVKLGWVGKWKIWRRQVRFQKY